MQTISGQSVPLPTLIALIAAAVATVAIGTYGVRLARTTSDFLVASRSVGSNWNAAAISGEYLSAASFLGVAGLIAKYGADALWYPIGFTAGYVGLLLFVAAPLRRSGAYTVPDFAEFRLGSKRLRKLATGVVVLICILYLVPQLQGAGLTLNILLGVPAWVGAVVVGVIVIANVIGGGMRSITFVQAFQYWLKLTAIAVPALVLAVHFYGGDEKLGSDAPPTVSEQTTVDVTTDVVVRVSADLVVTAIGEIDGVEVGGTVRLDPGDHEISGGTSLVLAAGSTVPVVAGAPATHDEWAAPGWGFGGDHPMYQVYSLIIGDLPRHHGAAPRAGAVLYEPRRPGRAGDIAGRGRSAGCLLSLSHLARRLCPAVGSAAADHRCVRRRGIAPAGDRGVRYRWTVAGSTGGCRCDRRLPRHVVGSARQCRRGPEHRRPAWTGPRLQDRVAARGHRAAAAGDRGHLHRSVPHCGPGVRRCCLHPVPSAGPRDLVAGLTAAGAAAGLIVGGVVAGGAALATLAGGFSEGLLGGWPAAVAGYPAAVSVPLAFATMLVVSKFTRAQIPSDVGRLLTRLHAPEGLGLGKDREANLNPGERPHSE